MSDSTTCESCGGEHMENGLPDPFAYAACEEKHTNPPRSYWCATGGDSVQTHSLCYGHQAWGLDDCTCPCHDVFV